MLLQFELKFGDKLALRTEEIVSIELSKTLIQVDYRQTPRTINYPFESEQKAKQAYIEICDAIKEEYQDDAN